MPDAAAFDWLCTELESKSSLDRLEARGTIRIALKQAGLDVRTITLDQMQVVIDKVLPEELMARGIDDGSAICTALAQSIKGQSFGGGSAAQSPDEIFRRLGGGQ